jgi:hypothetical protein
MTTPAVPPGPGRHEAARDHVTQLRQNGGTYRSIAAAAALSPGAVHRLAAGRRRAQPGTATAVLIVSSPALTRARLDAGGTRLRLRALHVMGHGSARMARAVGVHPATIRKLVRGDTPPSACTCAMPSPTSTTPGGTNAPPAAPASSAPPPPPPANAP